MTPDEFIDAFFGAGNEVGLGTLRQDLRDFLEPWLEELRRDVRQLPVFLPRRTGTRGLWYGIAPDTSTASELEDLLNAFVGTSYGLVESGPESLDDDDGPEAALKRFARASTVRLTLGQGVDRETVRLRLRSLTDLVAARPPWMGSAIRSLAQVLSDLELALAERDGDGAEELLLELEQAHHLSESNLLFLRIRLLDSLDRPHEILAHPELAHVAGAPRPRRVTRSLLEAAHAVHLVDVADSDGSRLRTAGQAIVAALGPAASTVIPPTSVPEARTLIVAGMAEDDPTVERLELPLEWLHDQGYDTTLLQTHFSAPATVDTAVEAPTDRAAGLVLDGRPGEALGILRSAEASTRVARLAYWIDQSVRSLDSRQFFVESALAVLDTLDPEQDTAILRALDAHTAPRPDGSGEAPLVVTPTSWSDWLGFLGSDTDGDVLVSAAELGHLEWPASATSASEIAEIVPSLTTAEQRVVRLCLGWIIDSHEGVLTSTAGLELLCACVELVALAEVPSLQELRGLAGWVEKVAGSSPPPAVAQRAVDALRAILTGHPRPATMDAMADVAAVLAYFPLGETTTSIIVEVSQWIRTAGDAVDSAVRQAVAQALQDVGAPVGDDPFWEQPDGEDSVLEHLRGARIGIHTLMASVASRAKNFLDPYVGGQGEVVLNDDHVATSRLLELAAAADVMVVVTAAAKHAATTAIEDARAPREVLRVNSKGFTGLVRAVTAHVRVASGVR